MGVSTDAILFYGYCWDKEAHTPYGDEDEDEDDDSGEDGWETRYARVKGLLPPSTPYPERSVQPTRENGWDSTPKDYSAVERSIISQYHVYWEAKEALVKREPCLIDTHCSASCPMPYVAVKASITASHRGCPQKIADLTVDPTWHAHLAEFCKLMEIKVGNKKPTWWLVSDWSE